MSSVVTSPAIVRRHPVPIAAVALAFTAAYTLAIGVAGGDRPPARARAGAVPAPPVTVTPLRDVARLPALRREKPPAPKAPAPVAIPSPPPSATPMPVATAAPPPSATPMPVATATPPPVVAPQPTPEPTFDSSG